MIDSKTLLSSRTIWSNLIGLAALGLGLFGRLGERNGGDGRSGDAGCDSKH